MAMYTCSRCGQWRDKDYSPCVEDPKDELGLMCEDCAFEVEEKETPFTRQKGVFTADQLAFIRKMEAEDGDEYE